MLLFPPFHIVSIAAEMNITLGGFNRDSFVNESAANASARNIQTGTRQPVLGNSNIKKREFGQLGQSDAADWANRFSVNLIMTIDAVGPKRVWDSDVSNTTPCFPHVIVREVGARRPDALVRNVDRTYGTVIKSAIWPGFSLGRFSREVS